MGTITGYAVTIVIIMLALTALVLPAAARAGMKTIQNGDTIYTGEEGLDLSGINATATCLVHYSSWADKVADNIIDLSGRLESFDLPAADVGSATGPYYLTGEDVKTPVSGEFVEIQVPSVTLDVVSNGTTDSVAGRTVTDSKSLDFKISHNLMGGNWSTPPAISIEVTTPVEGTLTILNGVDMTDIPLSSPQVCMRGIPLADHEEGIYTAQATWPSTNAQGFYNRGYDSNRECFDLVSGSFHIVSSRESVIHGHNFVVTITGESNHRYFIYIKAIGGVSAGEYPWIPAGQPGVAVGADPPKTVGNATAVSQADVTTTLYGTRPLQFNTAYSTREQTYIIEVIDTADTSRSENVRVKVVWGAVTICAAGTGTYYIGEEIVLSGTNTDSNTVYLYIVGQNLGNGNGVKLDNFTVNVVNNTPSTMVPIAVDADDTWEYRWSTRPADIGNIVPDSGCYTIYAVSQPHAKNSLSTVQYATASICLRSPFITAGLSGASLTKGRTQIVAGTATGGPDYVYIWIFGNDHRTPFGEAVAVETDGSFRYTFNTTEFFASGQYHVIVQHPMGDRIQMPRPSTLADARLFDIETGDGGVIHLGSLPADEAAKALTNAMPPNRTATSSPNGTAWMYTDDQHEYFIFMLEDPWILINPIPDRTANGTFILSGTTNMAEGNELSVSVTPVSLQPESTLYTGVSGTAMIVSGSPYNTWSTGVDASRFSPGEYEVWVEVPGTMTNQTSAFNIVPDPPGPGACITLFSGWNFISTPKRLSAGNNTASLFQHVDTRGHSIFAYDAGSGLWHTMAATDEVRPLDGIWIYANDTTLVLFDYDSGAVQTPPVKSLSLGWNAIGFSALEPASARDTLHMVQAGWANLIGWSAENQRYEIGIVNSGSGAFSDTRLMQPGKGYWLYMTEGGDLSAIGV